MPQAPCSKLHAPCRPLSFALVIPALNEEQAIGSTLERALAARKEVLEKTPVKQMHVVFVNDGSTDNTQAIADRFPEVIKIRFEQNRGYGAAIKAGFAATDADLVGFMDADGTCDPRFCVQLINVLLREDVDMALGNRMHRDSQMPFIRRLGNRLFAALVGAVSGQKLHDCASGMRVLRRSSLRKMHPLPDGLHFTPAMTCLALLDPRLRMTEVDMEYKERVGQSKLRVIKDGLRFLFIILFTVALFSPIKSLALLGLVFFLFGLGLAWLTGAWATAAPAVTAFAAAFGLVMLQAWFVGLLCHQLLHMLIGPRQLTSLGERLLQRYFWTKRMVWAGVVLLLAGLIAYGVSLSLSGAWRTAAMLCAAGLVLAAGWTALGGVVLRVIWAAKQRRMAEIEDPYQDRHGAGSGEHGT
jgi:glycosyltransferase involved in cell wall biosynthesis